jgi:imidazolonepropionase-like amidohydrolase
MNDVSSGTNRTIEAMFKLLLSILLLVCALPVTAAAQARKGTYLLTNARIETVTHGIIERGSLLIHDGKIAALGPDVARPADAEVIDCAGLTLYPGMIDAGTRLGLVEIGSLSETRDFDELGEVTPQVQAIVAVNPNSVSIPVTRVNGITTALTSPSGGLFPGMAALIDLVGYTPDQMDLGGFRAVAMTYPVSARQGWWDDRPDEEIEKNRKEAQERLESIWKQAVLYAKIDSASHATQEGDQPREYVPEIEALAPAVRREIPVIIEVNAAKDIDSAIAWVRRNNVRAIFSGVSEGWRVADRIAAAGIPCIVGPVIDIPARSSDRYDKAYANAGLLRKAGVKIAIRTADESNVRNLPFQAGFAAAYGLGRDEALRAVTIAPAEIFGVDRLVGSLEIGKIANLFAADGDPFEPSTNVRHVFIDGYRIPMESRQTELYKEFLKREPGLNK